MLRWHTLEYVTGGHGDGFRFGVWFESRRVMTGMLRCRHATSRDPPSVPCVDEDFSGLLEGKAVAQDQSAQTAAS
jgi:hypothetical protein